MGFSLPSRYGVALYNDNQIVFIPEGQVSDPQWKTVRPVISCEGRVTDIMDGDGQILLTIQENIIFKLLNAKEFFVGWINGDGDQSNLDSREISIDLSGILPL